MAEERESLREQQLYSFGRMLAGFSHEMKNHLGIIRESAGLISDYVEMNAAGLDPALSERLLKATAGIEQRVKLSADCCRALSGFAHRADTPLASFELGELAGESAVFLERFARLKQVTFVVESDGDAVLVNSPTLVHHLLYRLFFLVVDQVETNGTLRFISSPAADGALLRIVAEDAETKRTRLQVPDAADLAGALTAAAAAFEPAAVDGEILLQFATCSDAQR